MPSEAAKRMSFPDGLRAIAAFIVIMPHAIGLFRYWPLPSAPTRFLISIMEFGTLGVQIFFVLSGFVIAYSLREKTISFPFVCRFIVRRSVRLDPPYWFAIALFTAFIFFRRQVGTTLIPYPTGFQVLAHLFYLQDILGVGEINIVFWTLCIEIQLYVAFCLLVWLSQTSALYFAGMWPGLPLLAFLVSLAWPVGVLQGTVFPGSFLPHCYAFLAGATAWWTAGHRIPRVPGYLALSSLWIVAAITLDVKPLTVALTATALLAAAPRGNLFRWLSSSPIQAIGRLSYCIYLVHVPVAALLLGVLVRLRPTQEVASYLFFAVILLLTWALAGAMHQLIEKPALRWSKRIAS